VPSGSPIVETTQLLLRPPEEGDVDALFAIQGDAEAMRHTFASPNREATARYLQTYAARFPEDGFAPWTAVFKSEQRIIGWGGLNKDPEAPHWGPEISYFIDVAYWGKGLASELVQAAVHLAFGDLELPQVFAFTKPNNRASRRVLQKNRFEFVRYVPELERDKFEISRSTSQSSMKRER